MKDYQGIREKLLTLQNEFESRLEGIRKDVTQPRSRDWEEQATELENSEVLDALGQEAEDELRKIKRALNRLDSGDYGLCMDCGAEIPLARLEARPFSSRCVDCAEQHEAASGA